MFGFSPSGRVFLLRNVNLWGFHAGNANTFALGIAWDYNVGQPVTAKSIQAAATIAHVLIHETPELSGSARIAAKPLCHRMGATDEVEKLEMAIAAD